MLGYLLEVRVDLECLLVHVLLEKTEDHIEQEQALKKLVQNQPDRVGWLAKGCTESVCEYVVAWGQHHHNVKCVLPRGLLGDDKSVKALHFVLLNDLWVYATQRCLVADGCWVCFAHLFLEPFNLIHILAAWYCLDCLINYAVSSLSFLFIVCKFLHGSRQNVQAVQNWLLVIQLNISPGHLFFKLWFIDHPSWLHLRVPLLYSFFFDDLELRSNIFLIWAAIRQQTAVLLRKILRNGSVDNPIDSVPLLLLFFLPFSSLFLFLKILDELRLQILIELAVETRHLWCSRNVRGLLQDGRVCQWIKQVSNSDSGKVSQSSLRVQFFNHACFSGEWCVDIWFDGYGWEVCLYFFALG